MFSRSTRGTPSPGVRHAVALAFAATLLAGCGGSDEASSDEAIRAQLEAGFDRIADVRSADVSISIESRFGDDLGEKPKLVCVDVAFQSRGAGQVADRAEMQLGKGGCEAGREGARLIVVDDDLWISKQGGGFRHGRADAEVLKELTTRSTDFGELVDSASDLSVFSGGGPDAGPGGGRYGRVYEFTAPGSAFSAADGAEDASVAFVIPFDRKGYPRRVMATIEVEGMEAIFTIAFHDLNRVAPIKPPPDGEVSGSVIDVHSEAQMEGLLGDALGDDF